MKKILGIILIIIMVSSLMIGCTKDAEEKTTDNDNTPVVEAVEETTEKDDAPKMEAVEIRFALWAGGKELDEFQAIADEVNAEANGEYKIIVESIPDNYIQKLSTQFSGKNAADLIWLSQDNIYAFAELGALYDITDLNQNSSTEILKEENFFTNIIKTAKYDNKLFGIPWIANPVIMYYNTSLFDKYGVDLPKADKDGVIGTEGEWTWDDFIALAKQFPNGDGAEDYGWITGGWPPIEMYLWAEGGDILDENYKSVINTPESIKGLELAKEILTSGITPDISTVWDQGFSEMFLNGQIAMIMAGAADDFELREMNNMTVDDIAYGVVPSGVDGKYHSFNWTASTVMNADTENPEMAYKAMEAMTLKFFGWKVTPPIKGGIDLIDEMLEGTKVISKPTIVAALADTRGGNYHTAYAEIDIWRNLFEPLLLETDSFDSAEMAQKLDDEINKILNR
ncbi:MAG: sugar ABC transporter substrate-binding protein [Clostridiales bacterium]|nr:sugar ABC transporter substrate-binding protein [Clostridiales bacterium]